jgi:transcriptional regulator with XRE-family HTH domain
MTLGLGSATERQTALAARLRRLRAAAELGADELAAAAGLPAGRYQDAEAGRAGTLTYLDLLALADALEVPPVAVLTDDPPAERDGFRG